MKVLPLIFAVISVLMPVVTQKTGLSQKYGFKIKMLCAFMYLVTGVLSAVAVYRITAYSALILSALILGILGDFFLSYKNDKYFLYGVILFALGHIVYSFTFLCVGEYRALPHIVYIAVITVTINALTVIFAKVKLSLNGKKKLLLAYVPVLAFAFVCALTVGAVAVSVGNFSLGLCLISGGALFFASDIMIGIGKGGIERPDFLHNAVTYTYFAAQTLFALSIYFQ